MVCCRSLLWLLAVVSIVASCMLTQVQAQDLPSSPPANIRRGALLLVNGSILLVGGFDEVVNSDSSAIFLFPLPVYAALPIAASWTTMTTTLPQGLSGNAFGCSYDGLTAHVCYAGSSSASVLNGGACYQLSLSGQSPSSLTLAACPSLQVPRTQAVVTVTRDSVVVLGGYDASGNALMSAELLPFNCSTPNVVSRLIGYNSQPQWQFLHSSGVTVAADAADVLVIYAPAAGLSVSLVVNSQDASLSSFIPPVSVPPSSGTTGNALTAFDLVAVPFMQGGLVSPIWCGPNFALSTDLFSGVNQPPRFVDGSMMMWLPLPSGEQALLFAYYLQPAESNPVFSFNNRKYIPRISLQSSGTVDATTGANLYHPGEEYAVQLLITLGSNMAIHDAVGFKFSSSLRCTPGHDVSSAAVATRRGQPSGTDPQPVLYQADRVRFMRETTTAYSCVDLGTCSAVVFGAIPANDTSELRDCLDQSLGQDACFQAGCCYFLVGTIPATPTAARCLRRVASPTSATKTWLAASTYASIVTRRSSTASLVPTATPTASLTHSPSTTQSGGSVSSTPSPTPSLSSTASWSDTIGSLTASDGSGSSSASSTATASISPPPTPTPTRSSTSSKSTSLSLSAISLTTTGSSSGNDTSASTTASASTSASLSRTARKQRRRSRTRTSTRTQTRVAQATHAPASYHPSASPSPPNGTFGPAPPGPGSPKTITTVLEGVAIIGGLLVVAVIAVVFIRTRNRGLGGGVRGGASSFGGDGDDTDGAGINQFRIIEKLGSGGYGIVYRIQRKNDKREFAMKYIACQDDEDRALALKEFDMLKKLQGHPNIIPLIDMFMNWEEIGDEREQVAQRAKKSRVQVANEDGEEADDDAAVNADSTREVEVGDRAPKKSRGDAERSPLLLQPPPGGVGGAPKGRRDEQMMRTFYSAERSALLMLTGNPRYVCIVMEYFPQGDLAKYCLTFPEALIPEAIVLRVCSQVAYLLSFLHAQSPPIVHGDIKCQNILIDFARDRVVVTDFGLAVEMKREQMTKRAGTIFAMAPETLAGRASPKSDVYALGCVIYAMCTRRVTAETSRVMFQEMKRPEFVDELRAELRHYSRELVELVLWMLQAHPDKRPSAHEVINLCYDIKPGADKESSYFTSPTPAKQSLRHFAAASEATPSEGASDHHQDTSAYRRLQTD